MVGNKNEGGIVTKEIKLELRITVTVRRTNVKFKKMQKSRFRNMI